MKEKLIKVELSIPESEVQFVNERLIRMNDHIMTVRWKYPKEKKRKPAK